MAPASYIDTNIHGTLNVVQAARDLGVSRVVHTSTSETYGTAQFVPITEDHPLVGQSPYAASKIGADQIALSYWRSFETPVVVLRPFNTYGPSTECPAVIPTIITQIAAGQQTDPAWVRFHQRVISTSWLTPVLLLLAVAACDASLGAGRQCREQL